MMDSALSAVLVAGISAIGMIVNTIISKKTSKKVDAVANLTNEFNKHSNDFREHLLEADKTYLIDFLSAIENGVKKTDVQIKRAYEIYERYTENGGNSYVHDKWEEEKKLGNL